MGRGSTIMGVALWQTAINDIAIELPSKLRWGMEQAAGEILRRIAAWLNLAAANRTAYTHIWLLVPRDGKNGKPDPRRVLLVWQKAWE